MKLHWPNVIFCYVCMAMMGASCWLYCTWSFKDMWKGGMVGVGMFTVFLVWMWAEDLIRRNHLIQTIFNEIKMLFKRNE